MLEIQRSDPAPHRAKRSRLVAKALRRRNARFLLARDQLFVLALLVTSGALESGDEERTSLGLCVRIVARLGKRVVGRLRTDALYGVDGHILEVLVD